MGQLRNDLLKDSKQFHILRIPQYTNGNGDCMKSAARVTVCTTESTRRPQESEDWAKLQYLISYLVDFFPRLLLANKDAATKYAASSCPCLATLSITYL